MKTLLILLLLVPVVSSASDWSKADTNRQLAFTGVMILDWGQTRYIANHPGEYYEKLNFLLGEHPSLGKVNRYFISAIVLHAGLMYALPPTWRKPLQYFSISFETGIVARNWNLEIGMDF